MKILSIGNCCLCPTEIYKFRKPPFIQLSKGSLIFSFKKLPYALNEKGTTFFVLLTDGSRMEVSICKSCLNTITDEQVKNIYSDIVYTKLKALEKDRRKDLHYKLFERIRSVEIWRWAKTEQEIIDYLGSRNTTMKEEKVNA